MKHLFVIIDSLSNDYLEKSNMNFIKKFSKQNKKFKVKMNPSFTNRYEITMGKTSKENDILFDIVMGDSPYKKLKRIFKPKTNFSERKILTRWLSMVLFRTRFNPVNIPGFLLPYFSEDKKINQMREMERKRSDSSFFSMLEKKWIDTKIIVGSVEDIEFMLKSIDSDFVFLHYSRPDPIGHVHGPDSNEYKNEMKEVDVSIKKIIEKNKDSLETVIITSDHDMVKVKKTIDIWNELTNIKSKLIEDYLFFINSPVVRFWFKKKSAESEITLILSKMEKKGFGRIMKDKDFITYSITKNKRFGDLIFWLKPGYCFVPDFYMGLEKTKGMHGYLKFSDLPLIIKSNKKFKTKPKFSRDIIKVMGEIFGE